MKNEPIISAIENPAQNRKVIKPYFVIIAQILCVKKTLRYVNDGANVIFSLFNFL
jgi:hypothetical protein